MFARRRDIFIRKLAMQFFSVMSNLMDAIAELVSLARHLVELSVSNLCAAGGFCVSRVVAYPAAGLPVAALQPWCRLRTRNELGAGYVPSAVLRLASPVHPPLIAAPSLPWNVCPLVL